MDNLHKDPDFRKLIRLAHTGDIADADIQITPEFCDKMETLLDDVPLREISVLVRGLGLSYKLKSERVYDKFEQFFKDLTTMQSEDFATPTPSADPAPTTGIKDASEITAEDYAAIKQINNVDQADAPQDHNATDQTQVNGASVNDTPPTADILGDLLCPLAFEGPTVKSIGDIPERFQASCQKDSIEDHYVQEGDLAAAKKCDIQNRDDYIETEQVYSDGETENEWDGNSSYPRDDDNLDSQSRKSSFDDYLFNMKRKIEKTKDTNNTPQGANKEIVSQEPTMQHKNHDSPLATENLDLKMGRKDPHETKVASGIRRTQARETEFREGGLSNRNTKKLRFRKRFKDASGIRKTQARETVSTEGGLDPTKPQALPTPSADPAPTTGIKDASEITAGDYASSKPTNNVDEADAPQPIGDIAERFQASCQKDSSEDDYVQEDAVLDPNVNGHAANNVDEAVVPEPSRRRTRLQLGVIERINYSQFGISRQQRKKKSKSRSINRQLDSEVTTTNNHPNNDNDHNNPTTNKELSTYEPDEGGGNPGSSTFNRAVQMRSPFDMPSPLILDGENSSLESLLLSVITEKAAKFEDLFRGQDSSLIASLFYEATVMAASGKITMYQNKFGEVFVSRKE